MSDKQPTSLGWFILRKMADLGLSQTDLARRSGLAQASISRYIYGTGRPDTNKLNLLATGLAGPDGTDREQIYQELLALAGHGIPGDVPVEAPPAHRLAREVDAMLAVTSPLPADRRATLEMVLDDVLERYRSMMRRRRSA